MLKCALIAFILASILIVPFSCFSGSTIDNAEPIKLMLDSDSDTGLASSTDDPLELRPPNLMQVIIKKNKDVDYGN